jgi:hypothetical protein
MENQSSRKILRYPNRAKIREILYWIFIFILPVVLFFILLNLNWPISILKLAIDNSIFTFVAIFGLFVLCFHLKGKKAWLIGLVLMVIIFALPLAYKWLTGYSGTKVLGSFIPYKDGYYFYQGARKLLTGRVISNGYNDVFRPLFPAMEASILLFIRNNFMLALSFFVLGMGLGCYLAADQVKKMFGVWPAAFFMTLLVVYARYFIGYNASEIPGLTLACLAFFLLLRGARKKNLFDLSLGVIVLVFALGVRSGAFFILPAITFWVLFAFRDKKILAWKMGVVVFLSMSIAFVLSNFVLPRIIEAPGAQPLSIYANVLYGQAHGGAGPNQSGIDLHGATYPEIMTEALTFIKNHPLGLVVGIIKSYLRFFDPSPDSIFYLLDARSQWMGILFWFLNFILLIAGIIYCIRNIKKPVFSFVLACFAGLLVSLPLVPPMDLGNRIYAASIPFFFLLPALGFLTIWNDKNIYPTELKNEENPVRFLVISFSIVLLLLLTIIPVLITLFKKAPVYLQANCSKTQTPFAVQLFQGSYVDILKTNPPNCGRAPNICLTDFEKNGRDKTNDDFFQMLVKKAQASTNGIRLTASVDLISNRYLFFVGTPETLPSTNPDGLVMGCATQKNSQFQYILWVDSILE